MAATISSSIMVTIFLVLLMQSASVHSNIGNVRILNELPTEVRFVLFSDFTVSETQNVTDGFSASYNFDTSVAPFYDVAILAAHETPIKSKTIRPWKRGFGYPNDEFPVSNWAAKPEGLRYRDPFKGWILVGGWDG